MTGIFDVRVRVEENKLGKLTMDLAKHIPYAKFVGVEIVVPSDNSEQKLLPAPGKKKWPWRPKDEQFTSQQKAVLKAVHEGASDMAAVRDAAGFAELRGTSKTINNLKRLKYLKGNDGNLKLTEAGIAVISESEQHE
jgi:hypothetical protein